VEKSLRGGVEANSDAVVDGVISHVRELPELLDRWYV
jgi:putative hydrolase of the HAD superfamily